MVMFICQFENQFSMFVLKIIISKLLFLRDYYKSSLFFLFSEISHVAYIIFNHENMIAFYYGMIIQAYN